MSKRWPAARLRPTRALCLALALVLGLSGCGGRAEAHEATTVAMDTVVLQTAYGPNAEAAMRAVNVAFAAYSDRLSLFSQGGDIARVNAAAGAGGAEVAPETAALVEQALALSAGSAGAFAITVAPLTLAWRVTSDHPRVPGADEIETLLPLVDDGLVRVEGDRVTLPLAGMGIDLGGIAKGAACALAAEIYAENGVDSAVLSIGGNVYARGRKPDGSRFSVGFADPNRTGGAYIAGFELEDAVMAVSGGYERFFEAGGKRYIHIIDPRTGYPIESDIVSVGVVCADGAEADFWSTTLFVWGRERTLGYMRAGGTAIMLAADGTLYVSEALRDGFALYTEEYTLEYV